MDRMNMDYLRDLLEECHEKLDTGEKKNKKIVDELREVLDHIDNNFVVVYYP